MEPLLFLYMAQILPKCRKKLIPIVFDKWRKIIFVIFDIIDGISSKLPVIWFFPSHLIRNSTEQTISIAINVSIFGFQFNLNPNQGHMDRGPERSFRKADQSSVRESLVKRINPYWQISGATPGRRSRPYYWKTHPLRDGFSSNTVPLMNPKLKFRKFWMSFPVQSSAKHWQFLGRPKFEKTANVWTANVSPTTV